VGYLAAHWRLLKLACPGPPKKPHARRYQADEQSARTSRSLWATLLELAHDHPAAHPSAQLVERYLLQQADDVLCEYGYPRSSGVKAPLVRSTAQLVRQPEAGPREVNALLELLIKAELVRTKSSLSTLGLETYLGRIESWVGQAGSQPLWEAGDFLNREQAARRGALTRAANSVFEALGLPSQRPNRSRRAARITVVEYVDLPILPLGTWLERIERLDEHEEVCRSLQLQLVLACEVRSDALYDLVYGEVLPALAEVALQWEKFRHPGIRRLPDVDGDVLAGVMEWAAKHQRAHPTRPITMPDGGAQYQLGRYLSRIGFAPGTIHDIRALWCSLQYLAGFPLAEQAELMAHRQPATTLESYVLTRHLHQRDLALQVRPHGLPGRLVARLTGYSAGYAVYGGSMPVIRGLERLPATCFRSLSAPPEAPWPGCEHG